MYKRQGDGILKDFSGLLQLMGDTDGTVGYNGAGKFLAFFDECSTCLLYTSCLGIAAYMVLTLLVNRQTPATPDTHYTGTNGISVYYLSLIHI